MCILDHANLCSHSSGEAHGMTCSYGMFSTYALIGFVRKFWNARSILKIELIFFRLSTTHFLCCKFIALMFFVCIQIVCCVLSILFIPFLLTFTHAMLSIQMRINNKCLCMHFHGLLVLNAVDMKFCHFIPIII